MAGRDVGSEVKIRRARATDEPAVLRLLHATLGWQDSDPNRELFDWKHRQNPAGPSPAWVAEIESEIVGFRTFLRWRFRTRSGAVPAVRAVDTATHPSHQGKGIFSRLTRSALEELAAEGCAFVFNTPNDRSRPGYLKLGWLPVGRLPISVTTTGALATLRLLNARTPADRWSLPTTAGEPVLDVILDGSSIPLSSPHDGSEVSTVRSIDHLRWRYGFPPLCYRAIRTGDGSTAVFRLRRRGGAREAAICEMFASSPRARRNLVRAVLGASAADYAISLGPARSGWTLPGQGPLLVHRALTGSGPPKSRDWALSLGDIELF